MMDILIYGAGQRCGALIKDIKSNNEIRVKGIFDKSLKGEKYGCKIFGVSHIREYELPTNLPVVISLGSLKDAIKIAKDMQSIGFCNVYWYLGKTRSFSDNFMERKCIKLPNLLINTFLPSLELHVVDFCNLNCAGCIHFSPLFEKNFPDRSKRMEDLRKIKRLVDHVGVLSLLGGEPLLNPECIHYVNEARECFYESEIQVITNGLLLLKVQDDLLASLRDNGITLIISEYQPTHKIINSIVQRLEDWKIDYTIRPYDRKQKFNRPLSVLKNSRHELCCICDGCVGIRDGKVARCPVLLYVGKFNKVFHKELPEYGIWDISDFKNGEEFLKKMEEKIPLCEYCIRDEMEWHLCKKEANITDFAALD